MNGSPSVPSLRHTGRPNQEPNHAATISWDSVKLYCVKYNISYKKVHFGNVFVHQVEVTLFYLNQVEKLGEINYLYFFVNTMHLFFIFKRMN